MLNICIIQCHCSNKNSVGLTCFAYQNSVYWAQPQCLRSILNSTCLEKCRPYRNNLISKCWVHEDHINLVWFVDQEPFEKIFPSSGRMPDELMHKNKLFCSLKWNTSANFYCKDVCISGILVASPNLKECYCACMGVYVCVCVCVLNSKREGDVCQVNILCWREA